MRGRRAAAVCCCVPGRRTFRAGARPFDGGRLARRPAALFAGILGALYWKTSSELVWQWWDDPNYSHGFLVPLFSAVLIWRRRRELARLIPRGTWAGLPVLLVGAISLILGDVGAEEFLMRSSFIVILAGLALLHLGKEISRRLVFPLAFLFFMVPL
ncbi:MAG: archaeosortase/exosortase family protein, partial [candidate division NC10 bacterium]|nr:archaeosortase/exosortase family protein [candidate division NC10 bacterium]